MAVPRRKKDFDFVTAFCFLSDRKQKTRNPIFFSGTTIVIKFEILVFICTNPRQNRPAPSLDKNLRSWALFFSSLLADGQNQAIWCCGLVHGRAFRTGDLSGAHFKMANGRNFFSFASIWLKLFFKPPPHRALYGTKQRPRVAVMRVLVGNSGLLRSVSCLVLLVSAVSAMWEVRKPN